MVSRIRAPATEDTASGKSLIHWQVAWVDGGLHSGVKGVSQQLDHDAYEVRIVDVEICILSHFPQAFITVLGDVVTQ